MTAFTRNAGTSRRTPRIWNILAGTLTVALAGTVSLSARAGGASAAPSPSPTTACPSSSGYGVASGYTGPAAGVETWGSGTECTLVLYDTAGPTGYLGELYAIMTGNLASHWGRVTAEPVTDYAAGQVNDYSATVYLGSTFYGACSATNPCAAPASMSALAADVVSSTHPVIWAGYNQANLVGGAFSSANPAQLSTFEAHYGWDPADSLTVATNAAGDGASVVQVQYPVNPANGGPVANTQSFTRFPDPNGITEPYLCNTPGLSCAGLAPTAANPVQWVATAVCSAGQASASLAEPTFPTSGQGGPVSYPPLAGCGPDSIDNGSGTFPWAVRSGNLTYVGEIPLAYISETNRYLVFNQLLSDALAPGATPVHDALVRLEDVSTNNDQPAPATRVAPGQPGTPTANVIAYLEGKDTATYPNSTPVPFSVNLIPDYVSPSTPAGVPLVPQTNPGLYSALNEAFKTGTECAGAAGNLPGVASCGSVNMEGFTHQESLTSGGVLSNLPGPSDVTQTNPYDGISGDDFEFFSSYCSTVDPGTATTFPVPANVAGSTCNQPLSPDYVVESGPVPGDSAAWASLRVNASAFVLGLDGWLSGFSKPYAVNFIAPHYAMSATDYSAIAPMVSDRYDRALYYSGQLSGHPVTAAGNPTPLECDAKTCNYVGQFFPDVVTDVYGSVVIPENLGDYEPYAQNNHPPRLPLDLVYEAQQNAVLTDGTASFFYDAEDNGIGPLDTIISGIRAITVNGQPVYTFVSPARAVADYSASLGQTAPAVPAPTVANLAPSQGPVGGGNPVLIHGSNFGGATSVDFATVPASRFYVLGDSVILAFAPPGTGTVAVTVTTPGGTSPPGSAQYTYSPAASGGPGGRGQRDR